MITAERAVEANFQGGTKRKLDSQIWGRVISVIGAMVIWQLLHQALGSLIPAPEAAFVQTAKLFATGAFFVNMESTLGRVLAGFALAFACSVLIGIIMGTSKWGEHLFDWLVVVGISIPGLIWALISVMLFGLSWIGPIFAVFITVMPMLTTNIWQGVKTLERDLIDMSNVYRASTPDKLKDVILPHLSSHLLAATRYGLGLAWKVVVVVEMFGASSGIGYQLQNAYQKYDFTSVLAWTISFTVVMVIIEYGIIGIIEKKVTGWRPKVIVWR